MARWFVLLLAVLAPACVVDTSPRDEAAPSAGAPLPVRGIAVAPFHHETAGFTVFLPVGRGWNVAELSHRFVALQSGVQRPVTMVVSVRRDTTLEDREARWRSAFEDKDFHIIERTPLKGGVFLAAEGREVVSGASVDYVILRRDPSGSIVQCSVGAPVDEARAWWQALQEICDGVVVS